jgi:hypothetical protein
VAAPNSSGVTAVARQMAVTTKLPVMHRFFFSSGNRFKKFENTLKKKKKKIFI